MAIHEHIQDNPIVGEVRDLISVMKWGPGWLSYLDSMGFEQHIVADMYADRKEATEHPERYRLQFVGTPEEFPGTMWELQKR